MICSPYQHLPVKVQMSSNQKLEEKKKELKKQIVGVSCWVSVEQEIASLLKVFVQIRRL